MRGISLGLNRNSLLLRATWASNDIKIRSSKKLLRSYEVAAVNDCF